MSAMLSLHDYLGLIALLVSLACYKSLKHSPLIGFIPVLAFTLVVEWGALFGLYIINDSNHWIYNILTTVEFAFYFYLFSKLLADQTLKKAAHFSVFLFPVVVVGNCIWFQGFNQFHTNTYILGSLLIIFFSCFYFYQLLQTPKELKLFAIPFFWISIGLFFFYAGQFVLMAIFPHLAYKKDGTFDKIFHAVVDNLNIFLYCCFIIAFLCQRKTTNSFT